MNGHGEAPEKRTENEISREVEATIRRLAELHAERAGLVILQVTSGDDVDIIAWCRCGKYKVRPSNGEDTCGMCLVDV